MEKNLHQLVVAILACLFSLPLHSQDGLLINEVMSKNTQTLFDFEGDTPDWIEVYNNSEESLELDGYILEDNNTSWIFPAIRIAPYSFLLIYASDKDLVHEDELHANFRIDNDGEEIVLKDRFSVILDEVNVLPLEDDVSYGRSPDFLNEWEIYSFATPGTSNDRFPPSSSIDLQTSLADGFYEEEVSIQLMAFDSSAQLFYTLDGSIPDSTDNKYTAGEFIRIDQTIDAKIAYIPTSEEWEEPEPDVSSSQILRAVAYKDSKILAELTQSFWLNSFHDLPVVSIVADEEDLFGEKQGIYIKGKNENYLNKGKDWERPVHVSFFDENGKMLLKQNAGLRIGGSKSRLRPQKTLRLFARHEYGNSVFESSFWGEDYGDKFKRITLRTFNTEPWSRAGVMDDLIHQIISGQIDADYVKRNFVIVYLNGVYWGIHSMREHNDDHFLSRKYEIPKDGIIEKKVLLDLPQEEWDDFDYLVEEISTMDLAESSNYSYLESRLDLKNYTDYIITNLAFSNRDWPANNTNYWYSADYDGKIRFVINDLDATMLIHNDERLELFLSGQAERLERDKWSKVLVLMQKLLKNQSYRRYFNNRLTELMNTTFAPNNTTKALKKMTESLSSEIEAHCKRWHAPKNKSKWDAAIDDLHRFLIRRPVFLLEQSHQLFGDPMTLFPNPIISDLQLGINAWMAGELEASIYDLSGRLYYFEKYPIAEGDNKLMLELSELPSGIFFVNAMYQGLRYNKRFVKVD